MVFDFPHCPFHYGNLTPYFLGILFPILHEAKPTPTPLNPNATILDKDACFPATCANKNFSLSVSIQNNCARILPG